jgi:hypothetical protein
MPAPEERKPTVWQAIMSVLGAMFGVQSAKTRERDFSKGHPAIYIMIAIVFVVVFVFVLIGVVQWVMSGIGK